MNGREMGQRKHQRRFSLKSGPASSETKCGDFRCTDLAGFSLKPDSPRIEKEAQVAPSGAEGSEEPD